MGPEHDPKLLTDFSTFQLIMTTELATSLLNRATTGTQLLEILESIATDTEQGTVTDFEGNPVIW
jgi:hypothetical protein